MDKYRILNKQPKKPNPPFYYCYNYYLRNPYNVSYGNSIEKMFQEMSHFWAEDVAQLEECLPRMHKALGLICSTTHMGHVILALGR